MGIRLKRSKGDYPPDTCAVSQCRRKATMELAKGVFSKKSGSVPLCDTHWEAYCADAPADRQAAVVLANKPAVITDNRLAEPLPPAEAVAHAVAVQQDAAAAQTAAVAQADADIALLVDLAVRRDMQAEEAEIGETLELIKALAVRTQADVDFANECLLDAKSKSKRFKDLRTRATKKMRDRLEEVRCWFRATINGYEEAERILKAKIRDGMASMEAQRVAQIAAASQAHQAGDMQAVRAMVESANTAEAHLPQNLSMIEAWHVRIDNEAMVPREFCSPDRSKLQAYVDAHRDAAQVAGVTFYREDRVQARRA